MVFFKAHKYSKKPIVMVSDVFIERNSLTKVIGVQRN